MNHLKLASGILRVNKRPPETRQLHEDPAIPCSNDRKAEKIPETVSASETCLSRCYRPVSVITVPVIPSGHPLSPDNCYRPRSLPYNQLSLLPRGRLANGVAPPPNHLSDLYAPSDVFVCKPPPEIPDPRGI
ncbi:hypothetical protein Bbelb_202030 [Branchiostoma belcheri]|nr:hypothetical protein Bbelb_202030 [Branchiostoma belcheri]